MQKEGKLREEQEKFNLLRGGDDYFHLEGKKFKTDYKGARDLYDKALEAYELEGDKKGISVIESRLERLDQKWEESSGLGR